MKLHWRIQSLPEFDHLSAGDRKALLRRVLRWSAIGLVIFSLLAGTLAFSCLANLMPWPLALGLGLLHALAVYLFQIRQVRIAIQRQIIDAYRGQQLPICLKCGYDLRAINAVECPECGSPIHAKSKSASQHSTSNTANSDGVQSG